MPALPEPDFSLGSRTRVEHAGRPTPSAISPAIFVITWPARMPRSPSSPASRAHTKARRKVTLFEELTKEFTSERTVVRSVLAQLGSSAISAKRAVGQAAGVVLQAVAGGDVGSLALFRTLESLLIGVQGKRCLWRALQGLDRPFTESGTFAALEGQALDQWQRIEDLRQRRLGATFAFSNPGL